MTAVQSVLWHWIFFYFFIFFHLTSSRWTSSLPSCLWSQRIFPSLPGSRLTFFLSRCKFSTLTTRQPMVEFYLLTFPRFPLRKKEHKSYFGKNRTHDFRTSRCAAYLLDHSGDEMDPNNHLVCCYYFCLFFTLVWWWAFPIAIYIGWHDSNNFERKGCRVQSLQARY